MLLANMINPVGHEGPFSSQVWATHSGSSQNSKAAISPILSSQAIANSALLSRRPVATERSGGGVATPIFHDRKEAEMDLSRRLVAPKQRGGGSPGEGGSRAQPHPNGQLITVH